MIHFKKKRKKRSGVAPLESSKVATGTTNEITGSIGSESSADGGSVAVEGGKKKTAKDKKSGVAPLESSKVATNITGSVNHADCSSGMTKSMKQGKGIKKKSGVAPLGSSKTAAAAGGSAGSAVCSWLSVVEKDALRALEKRIRSRRVAEKERTKKERRSPA